MAVETHALICFSDDFALLLMMSTIVGFSFETFTNKTKHKRHRERKTETNVVKDLDAFEGVWSVLFLSILGPALFDKLVRRNAGKDFKIKESNLLGDVFCFCRLVLGDSI